MFTSTRSRYMSPGQDIAVIAISRANLSVGNSLVNKTIRRRSTSHATLYLFHCKSLVATERNERLYGAYPVVKSANVSWSPTLYCLRQSEALCIITTTITQSCGKYNHRTWPSQFPVASCATSSVLEQTVS